MICDDVHSNFSIINLLISSQQAPYNAAWPFKICQTNPNTNIRVNFQQALIIHLALTITSILIQY